MRRVAIISLHTSPLLQPGSGDSGGMNVYVRELVSALAHTGLDCTTFTRCNTPGLPREVVVEPGHRVVHIEAGPHFLPKEALVDTTDQFADAVIDWCAAHGLPDIVHGNYWLSGVVAHQLKHRLDIPFVSTFHTLARVKAEGGDPEPQWRDRTEAELIRCADAICVSCESEEQQFRRLYGDPAGRLHTVSPGVEHALFAPGNRNGARAAIDLPTDRPVLLFVGRIQPLKGPDIAIRTLAEVSDPTAQLVLVGGASGIEGDAEAARAQQLVDELGLHDRVRFVPPQPHHTLSTYYRAADVVLVPSRSESFGLVALEAAACGIPVVASAVGGLQTLVRHGRTGVLIDRRDPARFAAAVDDLLDGTLPAAEMAVAAVEMARGYTWASAAAHLRSLYAELTAGMLVNC